MFGTQAYARVPPDEHIVYEKDFYRVRSGFRRQTAHLSPWLLGLSSVLFLSSLVVLFTAHRLEPSDGQCDQKMGAYCTLAHTISCVLIGLNG